MINSFLPQMVEDLTYSEMLIRDLLTPLTNILILFMVIAMFVTPHILRKKRKIKRRDDLIILNTFVICTYILLSMIIAYVVINKSFNQSRDYMMIPKIIFCIVGLLNVIIGFKYLFKDVIIKLKEKNESTKTKQVKNKENTYIEKEKIKISLENAKETVINTITDLKEKISKK
ncbi:MAG: hypothetical protein PHR25_03965 [Clostridia bacterium]|nr:hypothetical protein [Clostridia bacterium]MDD4375918.1 hypothetical protein [Clostridia bacterium]